MTDEVLYEVADHIGIITLNAPERMNTISTIMLNQICDRLLEADRDDDVHCIVLTGKGRAFCAGLDMSAAASGGIAAAFGDNPNPKKSRFPNLDIRHTPPTVLHGLDTPTICALNGGAAGYGFDIAMGCDMRVMADNAKLAPAFVKRGIVPESGGTWHLPRLLGWAKASELIFTGRTVLADEALDYGLVNRVVPGDTIMDEALALAKDVAANAPRAVEAAKRMMRMGLNETFPDHVHHVYLQLLPLFQSKDAMEGIKAFMEKRDPEFKGE